MTAQHDPRLTEMLARYRAHLDKSAASSLLVLDDNISHLAWFADSPYTHPDDRAEVAAFMEEWARTVGTIRRTLNAAPPPSR